MRARTIAGLLMVALIAAMLINQTIWQFFVLGLIAAVTSEIMRHPFVAPKRLELSSSRLMRKAAPLILYWALVFIGLYCLGMLRLGDNGILLVLLVLAPAAMNDTAALMYGKSAGRVKRQLPGILANVSPNKSIQGLKAGVAYGYLGYLIVWSVGVMLLRLDIPIWQSVVFGLIHPWLAVAGDLIESAVKRVWGIKCFANYIPGHECVADRVDSWILTSIAAYVLMVGLA